jgi:hypothetical protein
MDGRGQCNTHQPDASILDTPSRAERGKCASRQGQFFICAGSAVTICGKNQISSTAITIR